MASIELYGFDTAIQLVLKNEGGYSNHPFDKGKATNFGITLATLSAFRGRGVTENDVFSMTQHEAERIYLESYWKPSKLDQLTNDIFATLIFDQVVNRGQQAAVANAQAAFNKLYPNGMRLSMDGLLGSRTIAALNLISGEDKLRFCLAFLAESSEDYGRICIKDVNQTAFLLGWMRRINRSIEYVAKNIRRLI